ncbi:hypothetical protein O0466_000444 [Salmonella enterica]|nr:hypothetical protein [Salmonella enterica]HCM1893431.1 hypothetical protein [Salmonella enterica subsp. diarizonae serovar 57:c:e,n,x,z15]EKF8523549.1 hypothetical protein [Salmonella enterica]EKM8515923.1 hypothetical protein [Salmonella enterica]ELB6046824.1 hypothetical protein [Salmonella enterica]
MRNTKVKPVLLSNEHIDALHRMQERERKKSPLGIAPSIHEIARSIMTKALAEQEGATA